MDLSGSLNDLEARLAGRALAWVGGLALVLGAIFFLSLAFSRGWIGPELRVLLGLAAGSALLAGGAAFLERDNRLMGHVLTPVGLAIISISLVGATRLYHLVPVEIGLLVALLSAIIAAAIAVRADSQIVAAFGLVAVLIAPPLLGATPDLATLAFIAVVLVGTTAVALWRSWPWLPPVAFVLSAPQAASWIAGDPQPSVGLAGIGLFWLLNVIAAGGEEFRRHRDDLSPSSAGLLLANAAFLVWAGFSLLSGDLESYRGLFLLVVAVGHLGVGAFFVLRDGERNLFGLLALGTGIAALTMAVPIQLGASAVPVAWTAEGVILAWLAARRGHPLSALVSAVMFALAGADLVRLFGPALGAEPDLAALGGPGAALGFFLAGVAVGVWFVRDRSLRSGLAAWGVLIALGCASSALAPAPLVIAATIILVVGAATRRVLPRLPEAPIPWQVEGLIPKALQGIGDWRRPTDALLPLSMLVVGLMSTWTFVAALPAPIVEGTASGTAFLDATGAALATYLLGLVAVAWLDPDTRIREPLAALGLLVAVRACLGELEGVALVAAWAGLMVVGFAIWKGLTRLEHRPPIAFTSAEGLVWTHDLVLPGAALLAGILAAVRVVIVELPLEDIGQAALPEVPFIDQGAAAAVMLIAAVLASGAILGGAIARRVSFLLAGIVLAYTIPFEVEPWAASVLWVALGGLSMVVARLDPPARPVFLTAAAIAFVTSATVAVVVVAPPSRLGVGNVVITPLVVLESAAALGAVVAGFAALGRAGRPEPWGRWSWLLAGVTLVYLLSVTVVGLVATQVGGTVATEELRTQAQVALSVLWAVLGLIAFVAGLRFRLDDLRHGGLALLALAAAKVFLFDLAALDVAYRVISLLALGLLLLVSAWLWQRLQPRPAD